DALADLALVLAPGHAEDAHLAAVGRVEPFEDFDRRRLAGSVGTEKAEALAHAHLEINPVHRFHIGIVLAEIRAGNRWFAHARETITFAANPMRAILVNNNAKLELGEAERPVLGP